MQFRLLILTMTQKTDHETKIGKIEKTITDHDHNKVYY